MSEPDFEQIARQFFIDYRGDPIVALSEQFRLVWNAGKASMMGGDFQEGGRVAKPTDTIPVMLSPGSRSSLVDADQPKSDVRQAPDFEQIARKLLQDLPFEDGATEAEIDIVLPVLRLVWNARGAADIAKLKHEPSFTYGPHPPDTNKYVTASGSAETIDRKIRSLDR